MIVNPSAARSPRGMTVPLTVVKDTDTSLIRRHPVSVGEAPRILRARNIRTHDQLMPGGMTFDQATVDAAGVFLVGELERLDQRLHMPLAAVTWARDIDLREDVSIADERSSFTNSQFAQAPGIAGSNKAWIGKESSAIVGVSLDIGKTIQNLELWAVQLSWTIPELASAQALGRPIDEQKFLAMQLKHQMDTDEQVYVGDAILSMNGLLNHSALTNTGNAVTGQWATATPAQILADINALLSSVWTTAAFAVIPDRLLLSPTEYGILVSTLISTAGNISILEFILRNNLASQNGQKFEIQPTKWLLGTNNANTLGVAATNSMFAYVKDPMRVRFPMVPLQRTPVEYRDIRQITTYFGRLGAVEMVYQEVCGRRSNLG
jgi:hypothetical protein